MIVSDDAAWMKDARCSGAKTDLWFPELGQSTVHAIRVCQECPVKRECLNYALENEILHGVWGGKSARERSKILGRFVQTRKPVAS